MFILHLKLFTFDTQKLCLQAEILSPPDSFEIDIFLCYQKERENSYSVILLISKIRKYNMHVSFSSRRDLFDRILWIFDGFFFPNSYKLIAHHRSDKIINNQTYISHRRFLFVPVHVYLSIHSCSADWKRQYQYLMWIRYVLFPTNFMITIQLIISRKYVLNMKKKLDISQESYQLRI